MQQIASIMVYWLEHLIFDGTRSQESFRADNRLLSHQPQERDVVVRSTSMARLRLHLAVISFR